MWSEQSYSLRLGDVHPFFNYFVMASEQILSTGARVWCQYFQASRQTFLLLINGDESEPESHLPGIHNIPRHHQRVQHIYTPTCQVGVNTIWLQLWKRKMLIARTTAFLPPPPICSSDIILVGFSKEFQTPFCNQWAGSKGKWMLSLIQLNSMWCSTQESGKSTLHTALAARLGCKQRSGSGGTGAAKSPLWALQSADGVAKVGKDQWNVLG